MPFPSEGQSPFVNADEIQAFVTDYANIFIGKLQPFRLIENKLLPWMYLAPAAPKELKIPWSNWVPVSQPDDGRNNYQYPTNYWVTYTRGGARTFNLGQTLGQLRAGMGFGALDTAPELQAAHINNKTPYAFASALNAGFTTDAWDDRAFWVLNTANPTTEMHLVNRGRVGLGSYFTARENLAVTAANIATLLQDLVSRKGYDGKALGTQRRPVIWGPTESRILFEDVLQRVEWSTTSGTGGNNTAMQRAEFVEIPGLRTDLWGAAVMPESPWELALLLMTGAMAEQSVPQPPAIKGFQLDLRGKDPIPHRQVDLVDESNALSQMGGFIGIRVKVNETVHLLSPSSMIAAYTGAAS